MTEKGRNGKVSQGFLDELGRRLTDLREERAHRMTSEAVVADGRRKGFRMPAARTLRSWETAEREPGISSLCDYLAYYEISPSAFLWWAGGGDEDAKRISQLKAILSDAAKRRAISVILDSYSR